MKRAPKNPLKRLWNGWWFGPISPVPLGLFRIVFGCLVLAYGLLLFPERFLWFSPHGAMTPLESDQYLQNYRLNVQINLLHSVTDPGTLTAFFVVFLVAAAALTVGLGTRLSAIVVYVMMASLHNRNPVVHNSGDTIMMVMSAYLVLAPAGAALSLDRLIQVRRGRAGSSPSPLSPWVQRLMQLQVATVYCSTSVSKLTGHLWRNGTAVYYPLHLPDSVRFPVPWLDVSHLWFIHLLTWGAIGIELSLWTLVWIPRLRLWVLAGGVLLHLGIEYSMNIPLFSFLMIASYIVFLTEADLKNFAAWVRGRRRPLTRPSPTLGRGRPEVLTSDGSS